jgi:hypothetical protein
MLCTLPTTTTMTGKIWWEVIEKGKRERERGKIYGKIHFQPLCCCCQNEEK